MIWVALGLLAQFISGSLLTGTATVVTITAPTSATTYDAGTSSTLTTLAGTSSASDRVVKACTWTNSLGGSGTATGTTSWSVPSIALTVGSNLITVSCVNAGGGVGTDTLTVTRSSGSLTGYFVDSSCTFNGTGTSDQCAASNGAAGAYLDPQSCFTAVSTSTFTTCYIKNGSGTYTRNQVDGGYRDASGYYPTHSGTSGNKLTIRNYPGHTPTLRNCTTYVTSECAGATITANGQSYVVLDGLTIIGAIHLHDQMEGAPCTGCLVGWEVKNINCSIGWFGDGNWSCLYLEGHNGAWVHHNYIHDMDVSAFENNGVTPLSQDQGTAIKLYDTIDTILEYNTHIGQGFEHTGIDDKRNGQRNIQRYNYVENIVGAGYQLCSYVIPPYSACNDNEVYGNIAYNTGNLVRIAGGSGGGPDNRSLVYNNTGYQVLVHGDMPSDGQMTNHARWNNIIVATEANDYFYAAGVLPSVSDYNTWTAGLGFRLANTDYANLAAVVAGTTLEDNSTTTACTFVSAPTNLKTTGACLTRGRVRTGGAFTATTVEVGAYGVTSCVGYTCS